MHSRAERLLKDYFLTKNSNLITEKTNNKWFVRIVWLLYIKWKYYNICNVCNNISIVSEKLNIFLYHTKVGCLCRTSDFSQSICLGMLCRIKISRTIIIFEKSMINDPSVKSVPLLPLKRVGQKFDLKFGSTFSTIYSHFSSMDTQHYKNPLF